MRRILQKILGRNKKFSGVNDKIYFEGHSPTLPPGFKKENATSMVQKTSEHIGIQHETYK